MIASFAGSPVQGMAAIPVMFQVKEFYDCVVRVNYHLLILTGYRFNLRFILTVCLNPDAGMLADKTAHLR